MEVVTIKTDDLYNIFKDGIIDLKKRFDSIEVRFESLEKKLDDNYVTKEYLALQLKSLENRLRNYEEMRQDIRKMGLAITTSLIGFVITIILYLLQSGLLKGIRL